ncbi:MAG TPA: AsmA-like C-terminal region-containing protein, partial [Lacunisphaera sp.]
RADLSTWPVLQASVATQLEGEFLAASVEAGLREQSARIHAEGRGSPVFINRVLARHTPRAAPYFGFGDPVTFTADAVLNPGWKFATLSSRVAAGRINSHDVKITAARGRIDIAGMSFLAHDARVEMGENYARGSYWMDFVSTDYRMLLEGRLQPVDISGWFRGDWWPAFWNRYFAFPSALPTAEVDIQGRWRDPYLSNNFVRAQARQATIWGGDFERVDATVFVRPYFAHGLSTEGVRAGGTERLAGTFKRFGAPGVRDTTRFEFDLATNAAPAVLGRMLEGRADDVLASLRFTRPPQVHAWGAIDSGQADYRFTGEVPDPLHYYGFPLQAVSVGGRVLGTDVQLDDIRFAAADGHGAGKATLSGPTGARRLGFDLYINKANLARAVSAVQEYDANRTGIPAPVTKAKFVQQAANSSLDVALSAQGDPADLASFKGAGNAALTGAELGEIHLFGLLSQVLNGLSLSFSSLKLDAARTTFSLQNGELLFTDFKVTGPSAVIDGRGKYIIAANKLDFAARFRPYEDPGSLLAAAFSLVLNPLTSILELKLTGPLADPKWSVSVSSGSDPSKPSAPPAKDSPALPATPAPK